jgi:hypothetical protein
VNGAETGMHSPGKLIEGVEQIAREFGGHDANLPDHDVWEVPRTGSPVALLHHGTSTQSGLGRSPNSGYWIAPQVQGQGSTILGDMIRSSECAIALPASVRHAGRCDLRRLVRYSEVEETRTTLLHGVEV